MIAPAMNTRPQETLSYRDLAKQQARVSRQIELQELSRLENLVVRVEDNATLEVTLQFSLDPRGLSRVEGVVSGSLLLNCHGCAEDLPFSLSLPFGCFIAEGEALAAKVANSGDSDLPDDVLVVQGTEVTIAAIVEDELLLSLPERLCVEEPCPRAPHLDYPAEQTGGAAEEPETDNPFSVLAGMEIDDRTDQQDG